MSERIEQILNYISHGSRGATVKLLYSLLGSSSSNSPDPWLCFQYTGDEQPLAVCYHSQALFCSSLLPGCHKVSNLFCLLLCKHCLPKGSEIKSPKTFLFFFYVDYLSIQYSNRSMNIHCIPHL